MSGSQALKLYRCTASTLALQEMHEEWNASDPLMANLTDEAVPQPELRASGSPFGNKFHT
jgi:hypothetical protein